MDAASRSMVKEVVHQTLTELGVDLENVQEQQADMHFLRRQRKGSEEAAKYMKRGALGLIFAAVPGILWLIWQGLKSDGV